MKHCSFWGYVHGTERFCLFLHELWFRVGGFRHTLHLFLTLLTPTGRPFLLTTTTTTTLLLLLYVHHTPNNQNENEWMKYETPCRGATRWCRYTRPENRSHQTKRFRIRNHEKCQTRNDGSDQFLLLFQPTTATATVFENTHVYIININIFFQKLK